MYRQMVDALTAFDSDLRLASLTREHLAQYTAWLYAQGKHESTVQRHYAFLRECHRLTGLPVPRWLGKMTVRYGRPPVLRRAEVPTWLAAELPDELSREGDAFSPQLLQRDSDLRALRPHRVSARKQPGQLPPGLATRPTARASNGPA